MAKGKMKNKMNAIAKKLMALKNKGVRKIYVFYTKEVNGKRVPNYMKIGITAALIAAAAAGTYAAIRRHKKKGHVLYKKKGK